MGKFKHRKPSNNPYRKYKTKKSWRSKKHTSKQLEEIQLISDREYEESTQALLSHYQDKIANPEWHSQQVEPSLLARARSNAREIGIDADAFLTTAIHRHSENIKAVLRCLGIIHQESSLFYIDINNLEQQDKVTSGIKTIARAVLADPHSSYSLKRSPFYGSNQQKIRAVGNDFNLIGDSTLMLQVIESFVPRCDQREIEVLWDGIGDWLC